jgi:predicted Ser/Thr protein kinase
MNLTGKTPLAAGMYEAYFNLGDGRGIKVLGVNCEGRDHGCVGSKTPLAATREHRWEEAIKEAKGIKASELSGMTPKLHGVLVVKYNDLYYPAIMMEHINARRLCEVGLPYEESSKIRYKIEDRLRMFGIGRDDLHDSNVLFNADGDAYAIDFSPDFFSRELRAKCEVIPDHHVIFDTPVDRAMLLDMDLELMSRFL